MAGRRAAGARGWVLTILTLALTAACTGPGSVPSNPPTNPPTNPPVTSAAPASAPAWMSGAAGAGVADGDFARWRQTPVSIAGTWTDTSPEVQVSAASLDADAEYGQWTGSVDIAVGAIFRESGETWSAAAAGAYDARWRTTLESLREKWAQRPRGTLFIRFAHEFNGSWSSWAVDTGDTVPFVAAWRRFRDLQRQILPDAQLVFCTNGDTSGPDYDWRLAWPGDDAVDVYATDWYSEQLSGSDSVDAFGAPVGLEQHRAFALEHGKPFALPEWGNRYSATGDSGEYISFIHDFSRDHAGTGPGQLVYEIYFNVTLTPNDFALYPTEQSLAPAAAATYRQLFG